ncbi:Fe-only nitrogenase accessory AnfO family protein [Sporomusa acidovorans]|uniref:Iron only nitrogenase protein AnfO n=1 Tax=Sporomusa acidovorans (strain ATCC 49682 / DSM 3132 / Mol) TaxID=1123286 RepID=A0ABZ3JAD6_SPOA4|nr:Fe-only nitrogenase accessory AnfO family protein [Sporomusa acidovorans]OZC21829.1 iron only nitrogenase protein AnfO [Sporomusa acidovorans DSM 3132]SDD55643.1 Fe-only nitrogenase accessory protein AnfO [Sporomusa acidovorans]
MARDIAVFIGDNGTTTYPEEPGQVVIYRRQQGKWRQVSAMPFQLERASGITVVRRQVTGLIQWLGHCHIFVALSVSGLLYKELEQADFSIWEFSGRPTDFLEYILVQEEMASRRNEPNTQAAPAVIETGPGCFQVSLKDIQQSSGGLTSKQVLQPLLAGNYYLVEVLCSHIPPWLEAECISGRLDYKTERTTNGIKLIIRKQRCG